MSPPSSAFEEIGSRKREDVRRIEFTFLQGSVSWWLVCSAYVYGYVTATPNSNAGTLHITVENKTCKHVCTKVLRFEEEIPLV